jgi:hypothetical protein
MKRILFAFVAGLVLSAAPSARACPMCKDAIPEAADGQSDFDPDRQSRGYNDSIYIMLAVPATLAAAMGFVIYRQSRKVDAGNGYFVTFHSTPPPPVNDRKRNAVDHQIDPAPPK